MTRHHDMKWLPKVGDMVYSTIHSDEGSFFYLYFYNAVDNYPIGVYNIDIGGEYYV
jgi:hypothetical protein